MEDLKNFIYATPRNGMHHFYSHLLAKIQCHSYTLSQQRLGNTVYLRTRRGRKIGLVYC